MNTLFTRNIAKSVVTQQTRAYGQYKAPASKSWLADAATYPLLAIVSAGCAGATLFGVYFTAQKNNSVYINKAERETIIKGDLSTGVYGRK